MRQEVNQPGPKPVYEKPTIEVLGGFAQLTLGGKDLRLRRFAARAHRQHGLRPRLLGRRLRIPPELTALEAVAGCPLGGRARSAPRLARRGHEPLAALASAIERTLESGPPAVAFSGGRDSSLLLAVAAHVCRRAGLEPPLPITLCIAGSAPEADEREWQELVLDHLQIPHWHRIPIGGELDLIGPYARRHLLRDGLLFPANAHSIVPLLEAAGQRCLIVGIGGDELLSPQQWRSVHDLLGGRRRPEHRDLVRLAAGVLPRTIRGMTRPASAESFEAMKWLRPATRSRLARAAARGFEEPVLWRAAVRDAAASRGVILPCTAWERLAQAERPEDPGPVARSRLRRRACSCWRAVRVGHADGHHERIGP